MRYVSVSWCMHVNTHTHTNIQGHNEGHNFAVSDPVAQDLLIMKAKAQTFHTLERKKKMTVSLVTDFKEAGTKYTYSRKKGNI